MLKLKLQFFGHPCEELTHWKRPWFWERLRAGGEGDDRGWDGWMASLTQWTWVWVNSRSWWWTGRPGLLQFRGSQRVGHDLSNWTELSLLPFLGLTFNPGAWPSSPKPLRLSNKKRLWWRAGMSLVGPMPCLCLSRPGPLSPQDPSCPWAPCLLSSRAWEPLWPSPPWWPTLTSAELRWQAALSAQCSCPRASLSPGQRGGSCARVRCRTPSRQFHWFAASPIWLPGLALLGRSYFLLPFCRNPWQLPGLAFGAAAWVLSHIRLCLISG